MSGANQEPRRINAPGAGGHVPRAALPARDQADRPAALQQNSGDLDPSAPHAIALATSGPVWTPPVPASNRA
jgi:hypothetical protein